MSIPDSDGEKVLWLLNGWCTTGRPIFETTFPSATTAPTEKECLAATARVLREIRHYLPPYRGDGTVDGTPREDTWLDVLGALIMAFELRPLTPRATGHGAFSLKAPLPKCLTGTAAAASRGWCTNCASREKGSRKPKEK